MAESDNPNLPEDPLEEILRNARWPEPTGLSRNRLEVRWESLARDRFRAHRRLMRWALAASIALAFGLGMGGWLLLRPGQPNVLPPAPNVVSPQMADAPKTLPKETRPVEPLVRTPTRYEATAFRLAVQHQKRIGNQGAVKPLLTVLNEVLKNPEAKVSELCSALKPQQTAYESYLLTRIASWNRAEQLSALKVLNEIGSAKAVPVLDQLSRDPEFEKAAWPVALHLAPVSRVGEWAKTASPERQKQAMQELLSRRQTSESLAMMLRFVALPETRNLAVSVMAKEAKPPVEELFVFLKQGTKEQRHTAGLVLGQIADPKVTEELLTLAQNQAFPPEVMIGLLNSHDRQAERFISQAKRHPLAQTAVQLACLEWEMISYTSQFPNPLEIH